MKDRLEGGFAILVVVPEMGEEKRDPGVFEVMLSIVGVILGWIGQKGHFWGENRVKDHHVPDSVVQVAGSCGRYRILL